MQRNLNISDGTVSGINVRKTGQSWNLISVISTKKCQMTKRFGLSRYFYIFSKERFERKLSDLLTTRLCESRKI